MLVYLREGIVYPKGLHEQKCVTSHMSREFGTVISLDVSLKRSSHLSYLEYIATTNQERFSEKRSPSYLL